MSGGSWEYSYTRINDIADRMEGCKEPLRRAFAKHLRIVSDAMKAIEWVDSGDTAPGDDRPAIEAVLGKNMKALEIEIVKADARKIIEELQRLCA